MSAKRRIGAMPKLTVLERSTPTTSYSKRSNRHSEIMGALKQKLISEHINWLIESKTAHPTTPIPWALSGVGKKWGAKWGAQ